jgi:thiol-disulfide isomerase/thioredoxin
MLPANFTFQVNPMNKIAGALLLALGLLQGCTNDTAETAAPAPGASPQVTISAAATPAAAMTTMFQDLQGKPLELSAYAGKKVFLNYWATWCAPCIREIPAISRAAAALEDENFVFLLASDETLEVISNFLEDREFSGNFIKLNGFFGAHGIDAVPSSFLYDESGALISVWNGAFEWDSAQMLAQIRDAR